MNNKNLYEILGISKNASGDDIKKAYRKLAVKYHPDKQAGKSDKEKKEAEEKFKDVSAAYAILSDPQKKARYDQFGVIDEDMMNGTGFDFSSMFDDIFANMFGSHRQRSSYRDPGRQKGTTIRLQIPVSIQEIFNGKIDRNIEYKIEVRCSKCHGAGGEGKHSCPHCKGTGMITETQYTAFGIMQNSHPCNYCHGSGEVIDKKCPNCNGTGVEQKTMSIHLNTSNIHNGQNIMFNGKGYESKYADAPNGDLIVELIYQYDASKYVIQNNTIYEKIDVPYYDCILGSQINHTLPNGEKLKINIPQYSSDGSRISSPKTFNGLNLIFIISVKLPSYINESERKLLTNIKNENEK